MLHTFDDVYAARARVRCARKVRRPRNAANAATGQKKRQNDAPQMRSARRNMIAPVKTMNGTVKTTATGQYIDDENQATTKSSASNNSKIASTSAWLKSKPRTPWRN